MQSNTKQNKGNTKNWAQHETGHQEKPKDIYSFEQSMKQKIKKHLRKYTDLSNEWNRQSRKTFGNIQIWAKHETDNQEKPKEI